MVQIADLKALVDQQAEETHLREFKRKSDPHTIDMSKEDRRLFGEALSGFANASGGVLILGIGTKRVNNIDRASELHLINEAQQVADRYRAYAAECVSPPLDGLKIDAAVEEDGRGLIVISVPRGQARPHMSTAPGHHTYYRRVIDSFVPMEHYEVDEMMRLKGSPALKLKWQLQGQGSIGTNRRFSVLFGVENVSRVTAKFPFITYLNSLNGPPAAQYGLDGNGGTLWRRVNIGATPGIQFVGGANDVVHPGQSLFVSRVNFQEQFQPQFGSDWGLSKLGKDEPLILSFCFGCEDFPITNEDVQLTRDQILKGC